MYVCVCTYDFCDDVASKAMGGNGVKVRVIGAPNDPVYLSLSKALKILGHLEEQPEKMLAPNGNQ